MRSKPIINHRRIIHVVVGITAVVAMSIMAFLVKPVLADEKVVAVCDPETVVAPEGSSAAYTYKLDPDCTLHVGPVSLPRIDKFNLGDNAYPIKQHDKVKHIIFDDPTHTVLNKDSRYLFDSYSNVESIKGIEELDTSKVWGFDSMFAGLHQLKVPVDLSNFNMQSATSMALMFAGDNLDMFIGVDKFTFDFNLMNENSATNFSSMFENTTSEKGIDLSGWNFLNTNSYKNRFIDLPSMFESANTPKIDVSGLAPINIRNASGMFANTNAEVVGLDKLRTKNMETAGGLFENGGMFENAKPTNHIDLSSWDTVNLEIADRMFMGSDIDKFSGMDSWNLQSLQQSGEMYANLNPTQQVKIQPNMPSLFNGAEMFSGSNLDMFPDIENLQLELEPDFRRQSVENMFENAKGTYVNISKWENNNGFSIKGLLASPHIGFATFGDKRIGYDFHIDVLNYNLIFEDSNNVNVWDRPDLPSAYSTKKWATLPIKQECEVKFDGNPDDLPADCWDDKRSWVSSTTGIEADKDLFYREKYHRIFFRVESIPVSFHSNGVENAHNIPHYLDHFDRLYTKTDDLIPNNVPEDPSGVRTFLSWNTQADGKGKTYHPGDHAGHDIQSLDLYAQWKVNNRTIRFIDPSNEADNLPNESTVIYGSDYTIPDQIPTRTGYSFDGWSTEKDGQAEYQPSNVLRITDNMTLYAQWKINNYSIRFIDLSNESKDLPDEATISYGSDYKIPDQSPTRTGYGFVGWATEKDGPVKYRPRDVIKITSDTNLYAQWKVNNYSIRFIDPSKESENLPDKAIVDYGSEYTIPSQVPTRKGHTFEGWATEKDGPVKYQPGAVLKVTSDMNLHAQWKTNNYSIKFIDMSKEDDNIPDDTTAPYGSDYTIPNQIPRRYGHTFIGWATEDDGQAKYQPGDVLRVTSNMEFYAQWKANRYSIRFVDTSNEAKNLPDENTAIFGNNYTIPDKVPTRTGYDFAGWATKKDDQAKYQPGDSFIVVEDATLYATWSKTAPVVKFNNNGGEGIAPTTKPVENDNTKIEVDCTDRPSKNGATFIGWSRTKNDVLEGSEAGEKGRIAVCGYSGKKTLTGLQGRTIDLYATWARNPKAVFNENRPKDMTALLPETKTITGEWYVDDSTPRTYVAPNIDGWYKGYTPDGVYQFDGWVNEDGSPFTGAYLERNDLIINAKWSRIKPAAVPNQDNDQDHNDDHGQNTHDNGNTDDNNGDTVDDNANTNASNNEADNNSNSGSDTTNNQQNSINRPGTTPIINSGNNQATDSSALFDPTPESPLAASGESSNGNGSGYGTNSDTGSPSQPDDSNIGNDNLAKTGASIIAPIVLIIVSIISAVAAILLGRVRNGRQQ